MATFIKWIDCDHRSVQTTPSNAWSVRDFNGAPAATGAIRLKNNTELNFTTPLSADERGLLDQLMESIAIRIRAELLPS